MKYYGSRQAKERTFYFGCSCVCKYLSPKTILNCLGIETWAWIHIKQMVSQLSQNAITQCMIYFSHNMDTYHAKHNHNKNIVLKNKDQQKLKRKKSLPKCSCKVQKTQLQTQVELFQFHVFFLISINLKGMSKFLEYLVSFYTSLQAQI